MIELAPTESAKSLQAKPAVLPEQDARQIKLRKATQEFESLFVEQMLKNMRRVSWNQEESGFGKDVMLEVADEAVSRQLAKTGMLGIGDLLYQRLVERLGIDNEGSALKSVPYGATASRPTGSVASDTLERYRTEIDQAVAETGLAPELIAAVIDAESGGDSNVVSPAGAVGLMQLMPATANEVGVEDSTHPGQNVLGGARYLKQMLDRFGDLRLALATYNAGPARVDQYGDVPPFAETRAYVDRIVSTLKETR
ncbi:MAG: lytic transglycosylase domain-containing protein [bacterium]